MVAVEPSSVVAALKESADRALRGANPTAAREQFLRAIELAPRRIDLWMGLAASQRAIGDLESALEAADRALALEPRLFPALLMKGSLLEALGLHRRAATVYDAAIKVSPAPESLAEPARRALAHAQEARRNNADELAARLRASIDLPALACGPADRRTAAFIDAMAGRRRIYLQEPVQFHYPGLPSIEFYERDAFPWLEAFEECWRDIRSEAMSVWGGGSPDLTPYVHYPSGVPLDQWAELNNSLKWSAFHLFEDGTPVKDHCAQCPKTISALGLVDQPRVESRSPAAMFSILRPRTRIPPHTGVSNTRLVLHLPLVVPEQCGFRVGGETRVWLEGEAWVFDDTIEHEAWNNSDQPRAILICDVWSPHLSKEEREIIARLTAAFDAFGGADAPGGNL